MNSMATYEAKEERNKAGIVRDERDNLLNDVSILEQHISNLNKTIDQQEKQINAMRIAYNTQIDRLYDDLKRITKQVIE